MSHSSVEVPVVLNASLCIDCGACVLACPTAVFDRPSPGAKPQAIYAGDCHVCFLCVPDCPTQAISVSRDAPNTRQISVYDVIEMDLPAFQLES